MDVEPIISFATASMDINNYVSGDVVWDNVSYFWMPVYFCWIEMKLML
jgi:hypothetical protein